MCSEERHEGGHRRLGRAVAARDARHIGLAAEPRELPSRVGPRALRVALHRGFGLQLTVEDGKGFAIAERVECHRCRAVAVAELRGLVNESVSELVGGTFVDQPAVFGTRLRRLQPGARRRIAARPCGHGGSRRCEALEGPNDPMRVAQVDSIGRVRVGRAQLGDERVETLRDETGLELMSCRVVG